MKQYDVIIIGFGKGGKTLAAELAKRKLDVAVVERSEKMYGGTCINIGCIPTKTLVHAAKHADKDASWEVKKAYYRQSIARKEEVVSFLRQKNYHNLADNPHITVYTGIGSFAGPDVVEVGMVEGTLQLQAPRIFINTGAETVIPPIEGIQGNPRVYTSTSIMELTELPAQLVIVGGGYIGLEFASMYAEFGSKVTILEGGSAFIPREDRDIADSVRKVLEKKGIEIRLNARAQSIHDTADGVTLTYTNTADDIPCFVEGDAILLATGRKPMIEGLNLQAAGIKVDAHGAIITDVHLHTTTPHIWAMGDVKGGPQFTYVSLDDFRIIRNKLFGDKERTTEDRDPIAYSVFIDPPLAHVGLTEDEAIKRGYSFKVSRLPATAVARARTLQQTDGMLKAIIDTHTGRIMGCTLFCAEASEIINIVNIAMKTGQHYSFLRDFIFTHPSMSEVLNQLFTFD